MPVLCAIVTNAVELLGPQSALRAAFFIFVLMSEQPARQDLPEKRPTLVQRTLGALWRLGVQSPDEPVVLSEPRVLQSPSDDGENVTESRPIDAASLSPDDEDDPGVFRDPSWPDWVIVKREGLYCRCCRHGHENSRGGIWIRKPCKNKDKNEV